MSTTVHQQAPNAENAPEWLNIVRDKVRGLRFGVVRIVIHDAKVTLIERTEKTRLTSAPCPKFRSKRHAAQALLHFPFPAAP